VTRGCGRDAGRPEGCAYHGFPQTDRGDERAIRAVDRTGGLWLWGLWPVWGGASPTQWVEKALKILANLEHRGACGCDPETGDGAGFVLISNPRWVPSKRGPPARGLQLAGPSRIRDGLGLSTARLSSASPMRGSIRGGRRGRRAVSSWLARRAGERRGGGAGLEGGGADHPADLHRTRADRARRGAGSNASCMLIRKTHGTMGSAVETCPQASYFYVAEPVASHAQLQGVAAWLRRSRPISLTCWIRPLASGIALVQPSATAPTPFRPGILAQPFRFLGATMAKSTRFAAT